MTAGTHTKGTVELRVHGVGGASPEYTLGEGSVFQVAGDGLAGFFRGMRRPRNLEAYSWGGLTTGSLIRALWVLLLPFAVVNVLGFMFPDGRGFPAAVHRGAVRVLGLVVTTFYTLWACSFFMDEVASQLLQHVARASGPHTALTAWLADHLSLRLALGACAAALVAGLWHLVPHLTRIEPPSKHVPWRLPEDPSTLELSDPRFWQIDGFVAHLARLHFAASANTIALACWCVAAELGGPSWLGEGTGQVLAVVFYGTIVLAVTAFVTDRWLSFLVVLLSVVHAAVAIICLASAPMREALGFLHAWDWPVRLTTFVAALCLLALIVAGLLSTQKKAVHGLVLGYGLSILTVHLGGATIAVQGAAGLASYFEVLKATSLPLTYHLSGLATAAVIVSLAAWVVFVLFRHKTPAERSTAVDTLLIPAVLLVAWASLALHLVYVGWAISQLWPAPPAPIADVPTSPRDWQLLLPDVLAVAVWSTDLLTLGGFLGLLYYWRNAPVDIELRRNVGRLWDVVTFWPRWFHPLAPPTSSQRAVPELRQRIEQLRAAGHPVLVSAHSQGSVLAFATLHGMEAHAGTALVTHGSPLQRIYASFFPRYFRPDAFAELRDQLAGRWTNLYRDTDPIGGKLFADSEVVVDPAGWAPPPSLRPGVRRLVAGVCSENGDVAAGHLHYDRTIRYHAAVKAVLKGIRLPRKPASG